MIFDFRVSFPRWFSSISGFFLWLLTQFFLPIFFLLLHMYYDRIFFSFPKASHHLDEKEALFFPILLDWNAFSFLSSSKEIKYRSFFFCYILLLHNFYMFMFCSNKSNDDLKSSNQFSTNRPSPTKKVEI